MINLEIIEKLPNTSYLKFFLERSYSIELLVLLYENKRTKSIKTIYEDLNFPKEDASSFRKYITYLSENNCIKIEPEIKDSDQKKVKLSAGPFLEFDAIIKFYERKYFLENKKLSNEYS